MDKKISQIIDGLSFSKSLLDSIYINGIDNCKKILVIHNNLETFFNMLASGEISIEAKEIPENK